MHHQSCGTSSMLRTVLAEPVQINTLNSVLNNDLTIIDILVAPGGEKQQDIVGHQYCWSTYYPNVTY